MRIGACPRIATTRLMSHIPPTRHPRHGRLHARRAAARRRLSSSSTPTRTPIRRRRACFEALRAALTGDRLRKYPDPLGTAFRQTAGRVLGVDPDGILIGNGSDDILTIVTRAFVPGRRPGRLADAELPALSHAGRAPGGPLPDGAVHRRTGTCRRRGRCAART